VRETGARTGGCGWRAVGPGESVLDVSIRSGAVGFSAGKVAAAWPEGGLRAREGEKPPSVSALLPPSVMRGGRLPPRGCRARRRDASSRTPPSSSRKTPCTFRFLFRNATSLFFPDPLRAPYRDPSVPAVSVSGLEPRGVHECSQRSLTSPESRRKRGILPMLRSFARLLRAIRCFSTVSNLRFHSGSKCTRGSHGEREEKEPLESKLRNAICRWTRGAIHSARKRYISSVKYRYGNERIAGVARRRRPRRIKIVARRALRPKVAALVATCRKVTGGSGRCRLQLSAIRGR